MRAYLAGLGVLVALILRGQHDAVMSRGFPSPWSAGVPWIYNEGFAPHTPDAQHLFVRYTLSA